MLYPNSSGNNRGNFKTKDLSPITPTSVTSPMQIDEPLLQPAAENPGNKTIAKSEIHIILIKLPFIYHSPLSARDICRNNLIRILQIRAIITGNNCYI